jgi:hypothetical protein
LRFGDVLEGFISTAPNIDKPLDTGININNPFKIDVQLPTYCVVMDPCCHIGDETILLSPLIHLPDQFWDSSYITEDVTRINIEGVHEKGFRHPEQWNKLTNEEKINAMNAEPKYGLNNYFIYVANEAFEPYFVTKKLQYKENLDPSTGLTNFQRIAKPLLLSVRHYALDFKKIYRVNCSGIHNKSIEKEILASKKLQLTIETRNVLRRKMGHYFGDIPKEDKI